MEACRSVDLLAVWYNLYEDYVSDNPCGQTQILFKIKGKRWEEQNPERMEQFANEYWTRPLDEEVPKNSRYVERGCYW